MSEHRAPFIHTVVFWGTLGAFYGLSYGLGFGCAIASYAQMRGSEHKETRADVVEKGQSSTPSDLDPDQTNLGPVGKQSEVDDTRQHTRSDGTK